MNIIDEKYKQKEIYYKTKFYYINKKMRLNLYKVLYMRNPENLLLEQIFLNYNANLIKETISQKILQLYILIINK